MNKKIKAAHLLMLGNIYTISGIDLIRSPDIDREKMTEEVIGNGPDVVNNKGVFRRSE